MDKKKVGHLALAIQVAFQELGVFPASNTQVPLDTKEPMPFSTVQAVETAQRVAALGRIVSPSTGSLSGKEEDGDLDSLRRELQHALAPEISRKEVALRTVPDGLVISLREVGFFESASADIKSSSQPAFSRIVSLLAQRNYRIRIEGHTDNVPIHNSRFDSNWELSTARATQLVRLLMLKYQFAPDRLSAAGYAAYHPVAPNHTAEGRASEPPRGRGDSGKTNLSGLSTDRIVPHNSRPTATQKTRGPESRVYQLGRFSSGRASLIFCIRTATEKGLGK